MPSPNIPKGIRNNNPGNIRTNDHYVWRHQVGTDKDGFCIFDDVVWGIRAICILWVNYHDFHGCKDVCDYITRWAPPNENDTQPYIDFVSNYLGIGQFAPLDIHANAVAILKAVITYENGEMPFTRTQLQRGITLAHER